MFKKKKKKCLHDNCDDCPLQRTLHWKDELKGAVSQETVCSIDAILNFQQRLENRLIGTQKASEQARNNSAKIQGMQETLNKNLSVALTNALNAITVELKQHINTEIEQVKKVLAIER